MRYIEIDDIDWDKGKLLDIYHQYESQIKTYINKHGDGQPIGVLLFDEKPDYLLEMESKFKYIHNSYYLVSSGYHPHIDDTRQCIISFELQNEYQVPLKFYDPVEEVFHTGPIMWNTALLHGSEPSPTPRIFYQVELKDDQPFEFYLRKYLNDELLV